MDLFRPGHVVAGRYRVERLLAKGGMGIVYVAEHVETEEKVALKVLYPHLLDSPQSVERLRLEARVATRLRSDHIVRVFDAGMDDGATPTAFIAMELLEGETLHARVQRSGPLAPAAVVDVLTQTAMALEVAHAHVAKDGVVRPIVHRDLKPENIFLCDAPAGTTRVKVLDFGIAKMLSAAPNVSTEIRGTPAFMALEQLASGEITPQSDIWALGLVAFHALTAKLYWLTANRGDGNLVALLSEVSLGVNAPASGRARALGSDVELTPLFDAWLARCLAPRASDRFPTAGEAVASLAEALGVPFAADAMVSSRAPREPAPARVEPAPALPDAGPPSLVGTLETSPLASTLEDAGEPRASGARWKRVTLTGFAVALVAVVVTVSWSRTQHGPGAPAGSASSRAVEASDLSTGRAPPSSVELPAAAALPVASSAPLIVTEPRPAPGHVAAPAPSGHASPDAGIVAPTPSASGNSRLPGGVVERVPF